MLVIPFANLGQLEPGPGTLVAMSDCLDGAILGSKMMERASGLMT